jgi:putative membrane protein
MILNFIKGIFIGLALVVPGLSASAFAVVLGIYDKLIESVNNMRKQTKASLKFLLPIGAGAAAGILVSAGFLLIIIYRFELPSYAFFIGLVLGSIPVIYRKMKPGLPKKWNFGLLVLGLIIIIGMGFLIPEGDDGRGYILYMSTFTQGLIIFGSGFIACFLIALPGVSGAMVLIIIGQFATVYGAVDRFARALIGQAGWDYGLNAFFIVLVFFVGAVLGLVLAARLIGALIKRHEASVYFAVMGLILGAVYVLYDIGIEHNIIATFQQGGWPILRDILLIVASIVLGYICTGFFGRDWKKGKKGKNGVEES